MRQRSAYRLGLAMLGCLTLTSVQANESEGLFFLNTINPLSVFTVLNPQDETSKAIKKTVFKQPRIKLESFNQIDVAPSLIFRQHSLKAIAQEMPDGYSTFASIALMRGYEPQNPSDHLKLKDNKPITQTDATGYASGMQRSDGNRWWSFAIGFNQLRKRDYQTLALTEKRKSLTAQYVLFDRSYAPYIASGFIGIDGGNGSIVARLTPYINLQDGLLVGPDFQFYHDSSSSKFKIGTAIAGMTYKSYEAILSTGYEQDLAGQQGAYFSLGVVHRF